MYLGIGWRVSRYRIESISRYSMESISRYRMESISRYKMKSISRYRMESISRYRMKSIFRYRMKSVSTYRVDQVGPGVFIIHPTMIHSNRFYHLWYPTFTFVLPETFKSCLILSTVSIIPPGLFVSVLLCPLSDLSDHKSC